VEAACREIGGHLVEAGQEARSSSLGSHRFSFSFLARNWNSAWGESWLCVWALRVCVQGRVVRGGIEFALSSTAWPMCCGRNFFCQTSQPLRHIVLCALLAANAFAVDLATPVQVARPTSPAPAACEGAGSAPPCCKLRQNSCCDGLYADDGQTDTELL
jgi:hypothetical protein